VERHWWVVDAEGEVLGRLATRLAGILRGKHKAAYTPHMDLGDYIVVVNAAKVAVTGKRAEQKMYYRHSGYPGGLREANFAQVLARDPERVIRQAVRGMLPRNRLSRHVLAKLKVYPGPGHPHAAQSPRPLPRDFAGPSGDGGAGDASSEA